MNKILAICTSPDKGGLELSFVSMVNDFHFSEQSIVAVCKENSQWVTFKHDFAPGIYLRQMTMKPEAVVVGAVHKRDHAWFLLKGYVTVVSEDGEQDYKAPYLGFSKSGIQRVIYAHEESVFQNVFKNPKDIKDIDLLQDYNCCINKEKYTEYVNNK